MNRMKSNKTAYWPIGVLVIALVLLLGSSLIDNFPLRTKIGFVGKIGLIVGLISFWLFTVLPKRDKK